jgi:MFS family permease
MSLRKILSELARYVFAATIARIATGASAVTIILLARKYDVDGTMSGVLAACLTAPHVLGPIYGRILDEARDPRHIIAVAAFMYPAFFQLAMWSLENKVVWLTISSLLVCGACSSFMMGGLSTQLVKLVPNDVTTRRRAQSWDTLTYGIGLTMGPLMIAVLASIISIQLSASILMSSPILAGVIILCFPSLSHLEIRDKQPTPGFKQVANTLYQSSHLKRTIGMTAGASFSIAALPVLAVYLGEFWQHNQERGAYLVTLYGVGTLCGALLLMLKPMRAEALVLLRNIGVVLLITLILIALSSSFQLGLVTYWLCGVVNSVFFAATLAARTEYAPEQGAAQVYLWVAAAKVSAGSIGAIVAGYLVDASIHLPLVASSLTLGVVIFLCFGRWQARPNL